MPSPPLAVPDLDASEPPATLAAYEAVQLFVERAQAIRPEFELTGEQHGEAVTQAGDRVRHMPLPALPESRAGGNLGVRQAP